MKAKAIEHTVILVWPDYEWCFQEDYPEDVCSDKSDDFMYVGLPIDWKTPEDIEKYLQDTKPQG